ncbi:hypothetical protein FOZ62_021470, partial [Perkinsus olseni]
MASLSLLTRRDFIELRNLPSPPEGVLSVARGLCLALGVKPKRKSTTDGIVGSSEAPQDYWKAAREQIFPSSSAISLLQRLVFFDKDRVPERTMRSLAALVDTKGFRTEMMSSGFVASKALARWLSHLVGYRLSREGQQSQENKVPSSPSASSRGRRKSKPGTEKLQPPSVLITSTVLGPAGERRAPSHGSSPGGAPGSTSKASNNTPNKPTSRSRQQSPPTSSRRPVASSRASDKKEHTYERTPGSFLLTGVMPFSARMQKQLKTPSNSATITKPDSTGASPSVAGLEVERVAENRSAVKLSARDQARGKEKDSWRKTLDEARREIRELKALESRILWNMRREERLTKKKIESEVQKDITEWRRKHEASLREGIEEYRKSVQQRELKENLESVQFKRERKLRAKQAELQQVAENHDAQREKSIQWESLEKERLMAEVAFKADQRQDRAETRQLEKVKKMEAAMEERSERSWDRAAAMEFEKRQLLAEKNRRLKVLLGLPVKQRRRLRKFGESGDSPAASVEVSVKKERPGEDQRSRHRPVKVRPILPVERLASFKKEAARSVFGANESPFRPKSSSLSAAKFVPKRPDARTVGSGEPTLAKAIGKIAREMNASSEEEPMPSSVKVILMNAMKESADKKRREKMKGSSRAAVISTAAHSGSSSRPIHQLLGGGLKAADDLSKAEHRKQGQPLTERPLDDVAFGAIEDGIQEYPPLSVPYYSTRRIHHDILRATGYTEASLLDTLKMEGKRPVLVEMAGATVEQESSGVSQLFVEDNSAGGGEESSLKQDQFFLVQLPNTFPRVLAEKEDDEDKQTAK